MHGYLSCKESFYYQTEALKLTHRTVAIDLPGFGRSMEIPFAWSLDDYVEFVAQVIDERCGGRADIVAHSFGARIAIKLAVRYPERVNRLLLTGAAGLKPRRGIKKRIKSGLYRILKKVFYKRKGTLERWFASPDYLAVSTVKRESFKKIVNEHLDGLLSQISAPVLLVFGQNDDQTPLYMARRLNDGIKNSALIVLKDCGHFCFSQRPDEFNAVALEYFSN